MKKILVSSFFIVLLTASAGIGCELTVRVPTGNTYPPFFMQDPNGHWSGLSIDIAEALLQEAGCRPVYTPLPFPRGLEYLKSGKLDMMLNMTITEERKAYTNFIGPQMDETVVLVVRKDSDFTIDRLEDLKTLPKPLGVERGKVYGRAFEDLRANDEAFANKLEEVVEVNLIESMLERGRISGFLGYGYNVFYRLKNDPAYANFTNHAFPINEDWVYFGFSKKSVPPEQLSALQKAYESAREKGVFQKILQRYKPN